VSRSYEYCFVGKNASPSTCGAARNCPESDEFADFCGTFSSAASIRLIPPDASCEHEHNPTASPDEHRKMPASAEHHEDGDRWQANVSDGLYGSRFVPVEDVAPEGRTRRRILSGHWMRACLHTCGLVFFRLKPRIIAFFPRFGASELDFSLVQNALNLLAFVHFKFAYVETHNSPPCNNLAVSLRNIGIPIGEFLKVKLTFLKRE